MIESVPSPASTSALQSINHTDTMKTHQSHKTVETPIQSPTHENVNKTPPPEPMKKSLLHRIRHSPTTVLAVVSGALFVDLFVYSIVIPVIPIYTQNKFNVSTTIIGVLFSIFSIGLVIATPIMGIIADIPRIGRRWPMLLGLGGLIASTVLYAAGTELWMLFVARFFQGVSGAASWVVGFAMVADVYPAEVLGSKLGIVMSMNGIGLLVGPTIGGILYTNVNYVSIFIICAAIIFIDLIARIVFIDEDMLQQYITTQHTHNLAVLQHNNIPTLTHVESDEIVTDCTDHRNHVDHVDIVRIDVQSNENTVDTTDVVVQHQSKYGILDMYRNKEIMSSTIAVVLASTAFSAVEPILAIYLYAEFGYSTQITGILYLAIVIPYMCSSILTGYIADKYRNKVIMSGGMILLGVSFPLLGFSTTLWSLILSLCFLGCMFGVAITPSLPEISEYLQSIGHITSQAQGYALFNIAWAGGALAGGLFSGLMYNEIGWIYTQLIFGLSMVVYGIFLAVYCAMTPDVLAEHRIKKHQYEEQHQQGEHTQDHTMST